MARSSTQYDQVLSYMDGVHVKIAEAYKPPRKVTLPAAYNNKFSEFTKNTYDFSLEKSVVDKVSEWKKVRNIEKENRKKRIDEYKKYINDNSTPSSPSSSSDNMSKLPIKIAPAPKTTILTPQLFSPRLQQLHNIDINVKTNGLDYADFDNDTSNPFDNVELKTINDMKELAQVLQPTSQWLPQNKIENMLEEISLENSRDEKKNEKLEIVDSKTTDNENNLQSNTKHRNISVIVQELQKELARPYMETWKPWPDLESPDVDADQSSKSLSASTSTESESLNPISELSETDQKLAKHLNDMGFSLSRAAKAISELGGGDNKKIVEYLLSIQHLEKLGLSIDDAEKSLSLTNYDQENAKKYHDNLITLKDLGFPEEDASNALLKCDYDRDKALDYLCA